MDRSAARIRSQVSHGFVVAGPRLRRVHFGLGSLAQLVRESAELGSVVPHASSLLAFAVAFGLASSALIGGERSRGDGPAGPTGGCQGRG